MEEIRRTTDGELCGHVAQRDGVWCSLAVFHAVLARHDGREQAVQHVLDEGLASLADRWTLRHGESGEEEIVCIQEANSHAVTVARGYYSMPGVPTLTLTTDQLDAGEWELRR